MLRTDNEQIIFVDKDGKPTGKVGPKLASHNADTKLHLAFSCYILRRADNKFLLTKRALVKKVWPGVWTNSVCGHPAPDESVDDAIRRRSIYELGIGNLEDLACIVPKYIYKTPSFNGIVEHEFCPIYVAYTDEDPKPNPLEVEVFKWIDWADYSKMQTSDANNMSYWSKDQFEIIKSLMPFSTLL